MSLGTCFILCVHMIRKSILNKYLINKIKHLEKMRTNLENILENIHNGLNNNYIDITTTLKFNDAIYDFYEESMEIIREICELYQNK